MKDDVWMKNVDGFEIRGANVFYCDVTLCLG